MLLLTNRQKIRHPLFVKKKSNFCGLFQALLGINLFLSNL